MKRSIIITAALLLLFFTVSANAGTFNWINATTFQWIGDDANMHTYEYVNGKSNWKQARKAASNLELEGTGISGHLVTLTTREENNAVWTAFGANKAWLGGYQTKNSDSPSANWNWVTGEDWTYTNWADGEPNDGWFLENNGENYLQFWDNSGQWNDNGNTNDLRRAGYIVEYDTTHTPVPATLVLLGSGLALLIPMGRRAG